MEDQKDLLSVHHLTSCVLFIPRPYNYKAIDAIIRHLTYVDGKVTKVLLVPIRVTINASHKSSPSDFYPQHHVWLKDINTNVQREHFFVWLRRESRDPISHPAKVLSTRAHLSTSIIPPFEEVTITFHSLIRSYVHLP